MKLAAVFVLAGLLVLAGALPVATLAAQSAATGDDAALLRDDIHWLDAAPPPAAHELAADPQAFAELLAEQGLALDLQARSVTARGGTLHDAESLMDTPVEYLVVTERGKTHESLFVLRAAPSLLDACLRALGLSRGSPLTVDWRDPPPGPEELAAGVLPWQAVPPAGELVDIDVLWTDDAGRPRREPLETLLVDVRDGERLAVLGWVYTGSGYGPMRMGRRVVQSFLADLHGDIVGISPLDRGGEGICVLERNSGDGADASLYRPAEGHAPARGTPVTLVFRARGEATPPPPARRSDTVVASGTGQALHDWLTAAVPWGFSGVVLAARDDELLLHSAYGQADRARGVPLTTESVFPLAALSQSVTAALILQLQAEGRLQVQHVIARHLRDVPADKAAVTVQHLLAHRSGLPLSATPVEGRDGARATDRDGVLASILATPLLFEPGTRSAESDAAYSLLAAIVERAADDTFRGALHERILQPARMHDSGLLAEPRWRGPRLARGRTGPPGEERAVAVAAYGPLTWQDLGRGALVASARDVFRFQRALSLGVLLPDAQRSLLLSPAADGRSAAGLQAGPAGSRGTLVRLTDRSPGYRGDLLRWDDAPGTDEAQASDEVLLVVLANGELEGVADALAALLFEEEAAPSTPPAVLAPGDPLAAQAAADFVQRAVQGASRSTSVDEGLPALRLRVAQEGWIVAEELPAELQQLSAQELRLRPTDSEARVALAWEPADGVRLRLSLAEDGALLAEPHDGPALRLHARP